MREKRVISVQEILFLLCFLILFGARAVGLYEGMLLYNLCLVLGLLIWGIKVLMTEHTLLEYAIIGVLIFLSLLIYKNTGEKGILLYFTMMLGMKNVSVKRVFKCAAGILSISYIVLNISALLGMNEEIMYIQHRNDFGYIFRHSLGYPHPNTLHNTYIILIVLIMYLVGRQNWKRILNISIGLSLISLYIYLYSGSRTGLLVTGFYLAVNLWFQSRKNISFWEKAVIYMLYPGCVIFSVIGPLVVQGKLYEVINETLNNRWMISRYYLENESITLFGSRFKEAPSIHYMLDSSFLYLFLQIGLVGFCIISILMMCLIHDCIKKEKRTELAIIVSFCIMGISDPFLFNLSYKNLIFLFIGSMIYEYLQKAETRLPKLLKYPIQFFKIGSKNLLYHKKVMGKIEVSNKDMFRTICLFAVTAVCAGGIYLSLSETAGTMYVNRTIWEDNVRRNLTQLPAEQVQEVYLAAEDVQQLKAEGNLIYHYQGDAEPMYRITGDAPRMEYIRNVASIGFWSGIFATVFFWIFKYTMRRKNNGIEQKSVL